ncbi:roadblock/LC7 domain-containing protein [Streptomyces sp. NPDC054796]
MSTPNPEIQQILDSHVEKISGVLGAVVASDEGAHMYWSIVDHDTAERRAPLASSLGQTAIRYAIEENGGAVRRVLIEMDDGYVSISRLGNLAFLVLRIDSGANLGTVGQEAALLNKRLASVLDTHLRTRKEERTSS